ncbi:hypothetical protein BJ138DRAFT_1114242 [Hygrophoropsis aurantiaca]|uniref:Uncharacterized protein n=1 Tax=Hygrophoropsis aurantiaca TaxID=72124 RepID=A0ACB8AC49_9AGAM|nr:hypothetical protein BJ138DRAFT_1114242 [Hygrophoropsis aurantiaca]
MSHPNYGQHYPAIPNHIPQAFMASHSLHPPTGYHPAGMMAYPGLTQTTFVDAVFERMNPLLATMEENISKGLQTLSDAIKDSRENTNAGVDALTKLLDKSHKAHTRRTKELSDQLKELQSTIGKFTSESGDASVLNRVATVEIAVSELLERAKDSEVSKPKAIYHEAGVDPVRELEPPIKEHQDATVGAGSALPTQILSVPYWSDQACVFHSSAFPQLAPSLVPADWAAVETQTDDSYPNAYTENFGSPGSRRDTSPEGTVAALRLVASKHTTPNPAMELLGDSPETNQVLIHPAISVSLPSPPTTAHSDGEAFGSPKREAFLSNAGPSSPAPSLSPTQVEEDDVALALAVDTSVAGTPRQELSPLSSIDEDDSRPWFIANNFAESGIIQESASAATSSKQTLTEPLPVKSKRGRKRKLKSILTSSASVASSIPSHGGNKRRRKTGLSNNPDQPSWPPKLDLSLTFHRQFIQCDSCELWYHFGCVGIERNDPRLEQDASFVCPTCNVKTAKRLTSSDHSETCSRPDCDTQLEGEFIVERILGRKAMGQAGFLWLAKWDGYPISQANWIPEGNISDPKKLFEQFTADTAAVGINLEALDAAVPVLLREATEAGWV